MAAAGSPPERRAASGSESGFAAAADESLSRSQRIRRSSEFRAVMSDGKRGVAEHLVAFWLPAGSGPPVRDPTSGARRPAPKRLGVVASRKVGGAVQRSRAKRRLRELYRRSPTRLPGDLVLVARPGIVEASWDELLYSCRRALGRARRSRRRPAEAGAGRERRGNERLDRLSAPGVVSALAGSGFLLLIRMYRVALSPLFAGACRFEPSCSRYAEEAIRRRGPAMGLLLAAQRLARCHPLGGSGYDPVPTPDTSGGRS